MAGGPSMGPELSYSHLCNSPGSRAGGAEFVSPALQRGGRCAEIVLGVP